MSKKTSYRWLMKQSAIAKSSLLITTLLGILNGILIIIQAAILAKIIDHVYLHRATLKQVSTELLLLLIITLLRTTTTWSREIFGFKTASTIKSQIRTTLFRSLLSQKPDAIAKHKTGALVTTIIEKVEAIHDFYADYLPQMTIVIILPLIILALVFMHNWLAGLILLITAPLIPLFMALIGMGVEAINQRHFQSLSRMSAHFLDTLQGLKTLSFFNRARAQTQTIYRISEHYREQTMRVLRIAFLSSAVLELFSTVAIAIVAVYLGLGLLGLIHVGFGDKIISLQSAFFILLLAPEFFMPLRQLGTFYHARAEAIAASTDLIKTIDASHTENTDKKLMRLDNKINSIAIKAISFSYNDHASIFNNFSCHIAPGERIILSGPSGTGKSTLLKLIAKLQNPNKGSILINDTNLSDLDENFWWEQISWLSQDPYLFHDTILGNITLGNSNVSQKEIDIAIKLSGVAEFLPILPQGLDTIIGERHFGLSGGQAQRVSLARAYLKDAPIILLDEPTTHLDQDNKQYIYNALKQWHGKKTVIIATHDHSLAELGDQIIYL